MPGRQPYLYDLYVTHLYELYVKYDKGVAKIAGF